MRKVGYETRSTAASVQLCLDLNANDFVFNLHKEMNLIQMVQIIVGYARGNPDISFHTPMKRAAQRVGIGQLPLHS